jgi:streptogramin lyase
VSVTVPPGVGDGTTLHLEGQGMPYYEGGPAGPLVLTIAIPAQASPLPLPQDSTDPTVTVSMPNAELPVGEDARVSPARPEAPGHLEPTVPASQVSESAPTLLATDATSLPTEVATPVRHTALPADMARSVTPPAVRPDAMIAAKPAKPGASRRFVLLGLAGLVIVALASGIVWFTAHQASPAGSITKFPLPTANSGPYGITGGPDGNLWFTENGSSKIGRITTSGSITEFPLPTTNSGPLEIAAGLDGNLWFTEEIYGNNQEIIGSKIGRITTSGSITEFPVPTANSGSAGITAGPDGNLWFTEEIYKGTGNNQEIIGSKIGRISPSGSITEFPLPGHGGIVPAEITAGPDGNLWFTEPGSNKIGRITSGK